MLNSVNIAGRLIADPEVRTAGNASVCSFSVAVDRDYAKDGNRETDFINVTAWRQTADFVSKYFAKGDMILVTGRLQTRSWKDDEGNTRRATDVVADSVYFGGGKNNGGGGNNTDKPAGGNKKSSAPAAAADNEDDDCPF